MIRELNLIVEWLRYSIFGLSQNLFLSIYSRYAAQFSFGALMLSHYSLFTDAWPSFSSGGTSDQVH